MSASLLDIERRSAYSECNQGHYRTKKKIEEDLAREQFLVNSIMDNVSDHIYFKDLKSRFLRINRALALRFGLNDPTEAIGKTDFDFFTSEHAQQAYNDEEEIIHTGKLLSIEEKETNPDGHDEWVSTVKMPLRIKMATL